jgi:putative copper export protein/streptogramin lyase/methionine-rich copper-binding protein CopC
MYIHMAAHRLFFCFLQGQRPWAPFAILSLYFLMLLSILTLLVLFPLAGTVLGHAFVLDSSPAPSESLEMPPTRVEVFLSEPVDDKYSEVRVIGPDGNQIDNKDTQHFEGDQSTLGVTLPKEGLKDGVYTVSTKMLSQIDGHVTDDAFVFGVGKSASLSSAVGPGQSEHGSTAKLAFDQLSVPDAIARYPALVGQVIVVGSAFASLWLWKPFVRVNWSGSSYTKGEQGYGDRKQRRTPTQATFDDLGQFRKRIDKRLVKMMLIGAAVVIIADFGMIYALAYSLSIGMVDAMTTKFGSIWFVRTCISFLLFALILFVYLKVGRRAAQSKKRNSVESIGTNPLATDGLILKRELVAILIIGILTLFTTSLMGHGAAMTTGAEIPITIDFVHNLAAATWIGGVIYLALVVVPRLRRDDKLDERIKCIILCIMIPRFSTLPVVVLGIIVITGPFLLYILEDDLNLTLASLYGKALLAKLIIAAVMLTLGGYNQRVIHKDALRALTAIQGQQEQQVIISRSAESKRSHSISSSSSSSSPDLYCDKKYVTSRNKLFQLFQSLGQKIVQGNGERHQFERGYNDNKSKAKKQYGDDIHNDIHLEKGENLNEPDFHTDDWSKRNSAKGTISRFNRSIKIEAILGILLLGAVAVLTNTGLPASEFQGRLQQSGENSQQTDIQNLLITTYGTNNIIGDQGIVSGYTATQYLDNATAKIKLTIDPFVVGNNYFKVEFMDLLGNPIDMRTVRIKMTQTEENIGPIEIQTNKISKGVFTANASFGLEGPWDLLVEGVRNETNTLNLVATFNLFVKPDLDQLEYRVTQIAMPDNRSQPLYPIYDSSRNSIWVGDTSLGSGRIFEYDIIDTEYREHKINGTNIITTMALDQSNNMIWFIDPISKVLGLYDPQTSSSQLYSFPNDHIVPSSIAVRGAEFPIIDSVISSAGVGDSSPVNGTTNGNPLGGDTEAVDRLVDGRSTVWITSPSTGEVLIFDPQSQNFTNSLSLPTPNSNPLGIAVDSFTGQIWIAEGIGKIANIDPITNFTINEYAPGSQSGGEGGASVGGGIENDTLISPTALLIDPYTGSIYISEHDGHVVSVFNPVFKTFSDFPPLAEDTLPFGMTLDKDRNLWVAEHVTNRMAVIDPSNGKNKEVTIPSSSPFVQYLTTDNDGRVWFAAQRGNAIGFITSSVNPMLSTAPQGLSSPSSSLSPSGIPSQEGTTNEATSTHSNAMQSIFTPLFNIGYENLLGPVIAIGVVASAAFYVNSIVSLKTSIRKVNGLITSSSIPSSSKHDLSQNKNNM